MSIIDELTDADILNLYQAVCIFRSALNVAKKPWHPPRDLLLNKHHRVLAKLRRLVREANHDAGVSRVGMN